MEIGTRVMLTGIHGTVLTRHENGICIVKWDSGMTERVHESELAELGAPPDEDGYSPDDPKHESFHERLAARWDTRPGK